MDEEIASWLHTVTMILVLPKHPQPLFSLVYYSSFWAQTLMKSDSLFLETCIKSLLEVILWDSGSVFLFLLIHKGRDIGPEAEFML